MNEIFVNAKTFKIMQIFERTFDIEILIVLLKMRKQIFFSRFVDCFSVYI